ncbi:MAG: hypothetical protein Kow00124_15020 [Anaerolineae bacterium]
MRTYQGEANPRTMFVEGPFGAGKTTFAIDTLITWLQAGVPPEQVLVMVPQRTLARRYLLALNDPDLGPLGDVQIRTLGGLAKEIVEHYWPMVAAEAGFHQHDREPHFLTIETAQYAMARFVDEAVQRGEFDAINVSPQQIARQVIDNLGKAALMDIPYTEVPNLLAAAWGPDRPRKRLLAYQAAGRVARAYREYCLERRLLDYALQIELFNRLRRKPAFIEGFYEAHPFLIIEHLEEESPLTHELVRGWLPYLEGGLLTYEWDAGYRVFLGADPAGAETLRDACEGVLTIDESHITSPALQRLEREVAVSFRRAGMTPVEGGESLGFTAAHHAFFPEMVEWVADEIARLVNEEGVPPHEIVVLAPYLSDALLFSLTEKLRQRDIQAVSHRPSRALRDEPAAHALLTLAVLAHPHWVERLPRADVAAMFQLIIKQLDPVRARLLAEVVYRPGREEMLSSFSVIHPDMQARITYKAGEYYERLRTWLAEYREGPLLPLDHLFSHLFDQVLGQPGYGFHGDQEAARVADQLIESARKFRQALFPHEIPDQATLDEVGRRYFTIVRQGLLAALYVSSWRDELVDAVFMAPAYTFLMRSRPVRIQFWLDVGSTGWWERLDQPLTHPYVLSPSWQPGRLWTDADEYERQQEMLYRLLVGLIRRTREHIYLGISDLGEQGFEQRGPLLRVFQQILRRYSQGSTGEVLT